MSVNLYRDYAETSRTRTDIVANSQTIAQWDFVQKVAWFVQAAGTTWVIDGSANKAITSASDNQTVAKAQLSYTKPTFNVTEFRVTITWGTITAADEGKYYKLATSSTVDGTSEATGKADAQLRLVKFESATSSIFVVIDTDLIV